MEKSPSKQAEAAVLHLAKKCSLTTCKTTNSVEYTGTVETRIPKSNCFGAERAINHYRRLQKVALGLESIEIMRENSRIRTNPTI